MCAKANRIDVPTIAARVPHASKAHRITPRKRNSSQTAGRMQTTSSVAAGLAAVLNMPKKAAEAEKKEEGEKE